MLNEEQKTYQQTLNADIRIGGHTTSKMIGNYVELYMTDHSLIDIFNEYMFAVGNTSLREKYIIQLLQWAWTHGDRRQNFEKIYEITFSRSFKPKSHLLVGSFACVCVWYFIFMSFSRSISIHN